MPTKQKTTTEAASSAKFPTKMEPSAVNAATNTAVTTAKANPAIAAHPEVLQGLNAWVASAATVDATVQKLKGAHAAVIAAIAELKVDVAAWRRATHATVAVINTASAGSEQALKAWGFPMNTRSVSVPTLDPPSNLRATYSPSFVLTLRWAAVPRHIGYLLQIGDGTGANWGPSIPCPRATYQPTGLTPGQKVGFRVAVVRKNGPSDWSDPLIVTAR